MSSPKVRLRVAFDRWAWPLVRRWFHFEVDSEFLRGVAQGMKWQQEIDADPMPTGNTAVGRVKSISFTGPPGFHIQGCESRSADPESDA